MLHYISDDILALFIEDGPVLDDLTEVEASRSGLSGDRQDMGRL